MSGINFETLWSNYPSDSPCKNPKTGAVPPGFHNQCAIKLGTAMEKSGISFKTFHKKRCPFAGPGSGMVAVAQDLADWLLSKPFPGCPAAETYTGKTAFEKIKGRTGIVFLKDYWQRPNETGNARTGDHIDLWNGSRFTSFSSWFRVHLGISIDGIWSDYEGAKQILFWPIP